MFKTYYLKVLSSNKVPRFLKKYLEVPTLKRLKEIGYFCGMDYASKDIYNFKEYITRYDHSLTVALLVYRLTKNKEATIAGLFHDISTPCFSHVIDYMNKDYSKQETAEKNILTPGATETNSGVFRCYDSTDMENLIKEVKKNSDYVISIIHFGKEGYHELETEQIRSAKAYIDAGSDAVIGHHAHALQGIEFYKNKPIIYNLGDFIFNSSTEETAMFQIKLKDDGGMDYYILPALQKNCYTDFLYNEEKQKLISNIIHWGINADIDTEGKITERK